MATPYYNLLIKDSLPKYEERYKSSVFNNMKTAEISEKKKLVDMFREFNSIVVSPENSVYYNVDKGIKEALRINTDVEPIKLAEIYRKNHKHWKTGRIL